MTSVYSSLFLTDGLQPQQAIDRYKKRRHLFLKELDSLTVIWGVLDGPNRQSSWAHLGAYVFQEPLFLFLTGINQPRCALILDPDHEPHEILLVEEKNPKQEFWDGVRFGYGTPDSAKQICVQTGFTSLAKIDSLEDILDTKLSLSRPHATVATFWNESPSGVLKQDDNACQKLYFENWIATKQYPYQVVNCASQAFSCRFPLDEVDLNNAKQACDRTTKAFLNTLPRIPHFLSETELAGFLTGQLMMQSSFGCSFPSIVASGANAMTLHYTKNDDALQSGEMVLLDFGLRWQGMHADVSRTVPVSGRFNPLQSLLYAIVLDAQLAVQSWVKPGVSLEDINERCWSFIRTRLQTDIRDRGGFMQLPYHDSPHNVSHLIGLQVHDGDAFRQYKSLPIQPGWLLSNEPGLYGDFKLMIDGVLYQEAVGIRLEDNLWVTQTGCVNLVSCPKSIVDIEACMAGENGIGQ